MIMLCSPLCYSCASCLALMAAILGWDFRHTSSMRASLFQVGSLGSIKRTEITSVSPGQSWSQVCKKWIWAQIKRGKLMTSNLNFNND